MPLPTTCSASEVPAVRGINEVLSSNANSISNLILSLSVGKATASGTYL